MNLMAVTVRRHEPRTAMRLFRNHFESNETALSWLLCRFDTDCDPTVVYEKDAATEAAERSRRYRFNLVNAIFSVVTLAGDDRSVLENE